MQLKAELGYSALIQVVKSRTAQGFVPNWATPAHKRTWSQPPIASRVLLEMYKKHNNSGWVVEFLFDDLYDWNTWFATERSLPPLNITCLGGPLDGRADGNPNPMQVGRWESGMDNSPMFDAWTGDFADNKMQMYVAGQSSLHTMDSDALATLATAIGRHAEAAVLQQRADAMRQRIADNLWDQELGVFVNKLPNGTFNRRISPTSFYPLIVKAATDAQVDRTAASWLLNSSRFCLSPKGDFAGNSDECYWGLPSISADDAAFPALGYWRGYVWGPMAMLTYWGLDEYPSVPNAVQARRSLVKQMNAMMLKQWRNNGDVCENFSPHADQVGCTGLPFYHWGALTGYLSLLEAGFY